MTVLRSEFRLILEAAGKQFDIVQFAADFSVGLIPTASVVLAVGRNAFTGAAAEIHASLSKLTAFERAKVYFCPSGEWSENANWPEGPHMIFDGYFVGLGFQKHNGNIQLVAAIQHWLSRLDSAVALSSQSHPSNPADLTFSALVEGADKVGLSAKNFSIGQTVEFKNFGIHAFQDDLWGNVLKPLACNLAKSRHVRLDGRLKQCMQGLTEQANQGALEALSRIEGVSEGGGDCDKELSCYTPKLALKLPDGGGVSQTVAHALLHSIQEEKISSYLEMTLWGKLVNCWGASFDFAVIPLVDTALVVPAVTGLRDTYCKAISACDYAYVNLSGNIERPLRGTAVVTGIESETGLGQPGTATQIGVGGCFQPTPTPKSGRIHFTNLPNWLWNLPSAAHSAGQSTGLRKKLAHSSITTPQAERNPDLLSNKDKQTRDTIIQSTSELFDGYAHAVYVRETLRGRNGRVAGKLRFDIGPGSTVKLEGVSELFLRGRDQLGQNFIGFVEQVSIGINAENGQAGTAFSLCALRTEAENEGDATSVARHPLYTTVFTGAPLVDALQFKEEGDDCC